MLTIMQSACNDTNAVAAQKTDLQIRGVPVALRDRLRKRAQRKGVSMSQYVLELIRDDLARPTMEEWLAELRKHRPVKLPRPASDYLHEARREEGSED